MAQTVLAPIPKPRRPVEPRSGHLTPQHRDLMTQHRQFDVMAASTAAVALG
jgi:hypothetical protein